MIDASGRTPATPWSAADAASASATTGPDIVRDQDAERLAENLPGLLAPDEDC